MLELETGCTARVSREEWLHRLCHVEMESVEYDVYSDLIMKTSDIDRIDQLHALMHLLSHRPS